MGGENKFEIKHSIKLKQNIDLYRNLEDRIMRMVIKRWLYELYGRAYYILNFLNFPWKTIYAWHDKH